MKLSNVLNALMVTACMTLILGIAVANDQPYGGAQTQQRMMDVDAGWGILEFNVEKGLFYARLSGETVVAKSIRGKAKAPVELMVSNFNPMTQLISVDLEPSDDKISVISANVNGSFAATIGDPPTVESVVPKEMLKEKFAASFARAALALVDANDQLKSALADKEAKVSDVLAKAKAAKEQCKAVDKGFAELMNGVAASDTHRERLIPINTSYSEGMRKYVAQLGALDSALKGTKSNVVIQTQIPAGGAALRIRVYDKLPSEVPDPEKLGAPKTFRIPLIAKKENSIIQFQAGLGIAYASLDNRTFTADQQLFPDGTPVLRDGRSVYRVKTDRDDKLNFPVIGYVHFRFGDRVWLGNDFALTVGTELVGSDPFKSFVLGVSFFPAGFNDIVLTIGLIVRQRPTLAPGLDIGSELFTSTVPTRNRFTSGLFIGVSYRIGG